ncbi:MAG: hypothetical protein IKA48_05575 [Fibrobacter sp.]|nr:hypothetical protein [Fibrobacter sp.]
MAKKVFFMMVEIKRLIVAALATLACVGMWGCGDDVSMHWSEERSLGKVVGFVDDSLVIVNTSRYWHEEVEPTFGLSYDRSGYAHPGLSLYNYRVQLDGPVWSDSLDNSRDDDFNYIRGQLSDSVIWGGDPKSEVSFWKIGEKPHKMEIKKMFDGCSVEVHYTTQLRPWLDGKILVMGERRTPPDVKGFDLDSLGDEYCQYGVLDTIQKTMTYKRLDGELKWIKQCDDVRTWGGDVYCVILDDEGENSVILKNENDTIPAPRKFAIGGFWGNMIKMSGNICSINDDIITCSDVIWYGNELKFYQSDEVIVNLE